MNKKSYCYYYHNNDSFEICEFIYNKLVLISFTIITILYSF